MIRISGVVSLGTKAAKSRFVMAAFDPRFGRTLRFGVEFGIKECFGIRGWVGSTPVP